MPGTTASAPLELPSLVPGPAAEVIAQLPAATPPAPWRSTVRTLFWAFRSTSASAAGLAAGLSAGPALGAAAFVDYLDGAVGPYREILATPRCVRAPGLPALCGHIPFIAVDSIPSVHGGRAHWALPKLVAGFTGSPGRDRLLTGSGEGWSVSAQVRSLGPAVPFRGGGACAQPWPDGVVRHFTSTFRGRARVAVVRVEVSGPDSLTTVLPAGRFPALLIEGRVQVGAPAESSSAAG